MKDFFGKTKQANPIETNESYTIQENNDLQLDKVTEQIRVKLIEEQGDAIKNIIGERSSKEKLKGFIQMIVNEKFPQYKEAKDIEIIYQNIFGFSFINSYIEDPSFEEMNGNAWNDIEVVTSHGWYKTPEHFNSPEHAQNIIKKMMSIGNAILNEADPTLDSFIGTGLRLTATISPLVDENVGVTFSLRKLAGREISEKELVEKYDSYSHEEVDFIKACIANGVSVLFGGATSSGKSSDMQTLVKEVVKNGDVRVFCIEENTRELDFIHKDQSDKITSRVVHTKTRENKNKDALQVTSELLVKTSLRYHPDLIIPAEMRGEEALSAIESALTGHTIVSSAHIQSVTKAYERILVLCQKANQSMSEEMLMSMIVEAFPIVVFKKYFKQDRSRRCLKIFEATGFNKEKKKIEGQLLYKFIYQGLNEEGKLNCEHKKVNPPSFKLCQKLHENGLDLLSIQRFNSNYNPSIDDDYVEDFIDINKEG